LGNLDAVGRKELGIYARSLPPRQAAARPCEPFICRTRGIALKTDIGSMEHPLFSLATRPDHSIHRYEHNGRSLEVAPGARGMATIWDKDVVIYCVSQLVETVNRGLAEPPRTVWVTAYDLLATTQRGTDGRAYRQLRAALDRLAGTRITTRLHTNGTLVTEGCGLIDRWRVVEHSASDSRMVALEIVLSEWLYNAALAREVLTISPAYFSLRKGLERRLYELARKHCGHQASWRVGLGVLHKKSGSTSNLKEFRRKLKGLAATDHLPDYRLVYDAGADRLHCYSRTPQGALQEARQALGQPRNRPS